MSFDVDAVRQIDRYPVERFLAEGGMAWVFRVKDPDLFDAPRALKLLKPEAAQGDDFQRFLAEAQILATIQHPNLIHVYDFGQDAATGCHFYTMDYIEGTTLADIPPDWLDEVDDDEVEGAARDVELEEAPVDPNATSFIHIQERPSKTRYTVRDVCEYFCGVLAALARLHRENVIHRDIKPENIFLTDDGIAVLGDLGIAKGRHSFGIAEAGRVPGTPLYMAPEHAMGDPSTVRSDVFSLGLSLHAVLSGETVYDQIDGVDASDSQAVLRHLLSIRAEQEELEFVFHEAVPDSVCDVIEHACHISESERYASADDFHEALRDAIDSVSRPSAGGIRPAVAVALALSILALTGYFGWQTFSESGKAVETEQALIAARTQAHEAEERRQLEEVLVEEERQKAKEREVAAQHELDELKAALERAKSALDPEAINAAALRLAQSRAAQAEGERLAEDQLRRDEREKAEQRELAARRELEELKAALEQAKNAPKPVQIAAAPPPTEDLGLRRAMKRYEIAYESRSIEDLNRVWSMSRFERLQVERLFNDCENIRVQVSFADANINGSDARVDYDETIAFRDCESTRPGSRYSELSASLARRGDEWQIKKIRER